MRYKLGEIFNLQMGKTPDRHSPKFWNEGTEPWISISDLTKCNKYIENTAEKITATAVDESGIKIIPKNTVIMSFKLSIGKVAITPKEMYSNEAIMSFIDKGVLKIEPVYLYYLLMHKDWDTGTNKAVMGKTLNKASLSQMTVNIHGYSEQLEIIKALDAASSIIAARKQQLTELDNLIKARFIELFGDRWANNLGWPQKPLKDCATFYNGKAHEQVVDEHGEYILVTSKCIASDQREYRRTNTLLFPLQCGDICMVMSDVPNGRALAKCMMITEDNRYTLNQRICCLRGYSLHTVFFMHVLNRHEYLLSFNDGDSQTNLRKDDLLACPIILPPMDLQEQFAAFVEQVDESKVAVQKALDEAQLLFDSLMQKYFG